MNVRLTNVISDITGLTGQNIIRAIIADERDPAKLAKLRHERIRASEADIAKSLKVDWRDEHLFWAQASQKPIRCLLRCHRGLEAAIERAAAHGTGRERVAAGAVQWFMTMHVASEQTHMKPWIALLASVLLAACASYGGSGLKPGEARLEDVQSLMGPPAMRWQEADGSIQLAYPRGPLGYHTFMVKLGPDGRLQSIVNVLEEDGFAQIHAGLSKEQVLRVLGPPDYSHTVYFKARDELVWDWRFCSVFGTPSRFQVLFDGTSGAVRTAMSQVEMRNRGAGGCGR